MYYPQRELWDDEEWKIIYTENKWFLDSLIKCVYRRPDVITSNVFKEKKDFLSESVPIIHITTMRESETGKLVIDLFNELKFDDLVIATISSGLILEIQKDKIILKSECGDTRCYSSYDRSVKSCYESVKLSIEDSIADSRIFKYHNYLYPIVYQDLAPDPHADSLEVLLLDSLKKVGAPSDCPQ
jgi:hypothetical protein